MCGSGIAALHELIRFLSEFQPVGPALRDCDPLPHETAMTAVEMFTDA